MRISGIIAEYDPFHNGHAFHIAKTKADGADAVVVVLGGEFTQRGEPAWCSKYVRARAALLSGADLVTEMPQVYASGSAERFAKGGVSVLDALGCVDSLSFGSECGDTAAVSEYAAVSDSPEYTEYVKDEMKSGISVMAARENAAKKFIPDYSFIAENANDTLGAEYIKWINRLGADIVPEAVQRYGVSHSGEANIKSGIAPASYLRTFSDPDDILPFIPSSAYDLLRKEFLDGHILASSGKFETAVLSCLRRMSPDDLMRVPDAGSEGMYNRVYDAIRSAGSLEELYDGIKTKRYAMSRVKRIVAGALLGLDEDIIRNACLPYVRVLGMNDRGAEILRAAKESSKVPVGSSLAELGALSETAKYFAEKEALSEDIWQTLLPSPGPCGKAYTEKFIKI